MVFKLEKIGPAEDIAQNVKEVKSHVSKYAHADLSLACRTLIITAAVYVAVFMAFPVFKKHWALWCTACVIRAGLNLRMFIIFHDCCHGNFFKSSLANMLVGRLTGSLMFTSWTAWGAMHNTDHHIHVGKDDHILVEWGATVLFTKKEYESYSLPRKILVRIFRDPIFFFTVVPSYIFMVTGVHNPKFPGLNWLIPTMPPFMFTPAPLIDRITPTLLPLLQLYGGYRAFGTSYLWFELVYNIMGASLGFILFHLQHYANLPDLYFDIPKSQHDKDLASLMGSTYQYVPEWFKWATFGIEYHHIHHFSTKVPSYLLRACHDEAPRGLWRYIKHVDFTTELQSLLLVMWNGDEHRFESFPELNWLLGLPALAHAKKHLAEVPAKHMAEVPASAKEE